MSRGLALPALLAVSLCSCSPPSRSHRAAVVRVDCSRTGRYLAAADAAGRVWTVEKSSGRRLRETLVQGPVNDLSFSPDERTLAIATRDLLLWDHQSGSPARQLAGGRLNYGTAAFLKSGGTLVTITGGGAIQRIEISSGEAAWSKCCTSIYGDAAVSPSVDRLVTAGHLPRLWDSETGRLIGSFIAQRSEPAFGPVAFQPDGRSVWIGCQDGVLRQWDIETRALLKALPAQPGWIESIAVSPDGSSVAFTVRDRGIHLWSGTIRALGSLRPSSNIVFTPDGTRLIAGTREGGLVQVALDGVALEVVASGPR